jgi:hypothetical protein
MRENDVVAAEANSGGEILTTIPQDGHTTKQISLSPCRVCEPASPHATHEEGLHADAKHTKLLRVGNFQFILAGNARRTAEAKMGCRQRLRERMGAELKRVASTASQQFRGETDTRLDEGKRAEVAR